MFDVSHTLDRIYEAAFIPENWMIVLDEMAKAVGAHGTVLFNTRDANTRWLASKGIMDLIDRIIDEGWTSRNPRADLLLSTSHHGFLNEVDHFTQQEYDQLPIYTDLMKPSGYGFGAATAIAVPSGDNLVFSVEKKLATGPVDTEGIRYLDVLRPHLARAAFLSSRFEFERTVATLEAMQLTGLPSSVLGFDGKVLAANTLFEELTSQITISGSERVLFAHKPANQLLAAAFDSNPATPSLSSRSFPLPQTPDAPAAVVHLVPVRGNARDIFVRAAFFLIITPVDRSRVPSAEIIQGLFDLTPTEARVARSIATGNNIATTSASLSVSPETTRSHVKAILLKAGMPRQADFMAAIASIRSIIN